MPATATSHRNWEPPRAFGGMMPESRAWPEPVNYPLRSVSAAHSQAAAAPQSSHPSIDVSLVKTQCRPVGSRHGSRACKQP